MAGFNSFLTMFCLYIRVATEYRLVFELLQIVLGFCQNIKKKKLKKLLNLLESVCSVHL